MTKRPDLNSRLPVEDKFAVSGFEFHSWAGGETSGYPICSWTDTNQCPSECYR